MSYWRFLQFLFIKLLIKYFTMGGCFSKQQKDAQTQTSGSQRSSFSSTTPLYSDSSFGSSRLDSYFGINRYDNSDSSGGSTRTWTSWKSNPPPTFSSDKKK